MSNTKRHRTVDSPSQNSFKKQRCEPDLIFSLLNSDIIELPSSWEVTPIAQERDMTSYTVPTPPIVQKPSLKTYRKEVTFTTTRKTRRKVEITRLGRRIFPVSDDYPAPWSVSQDVKIAGHTYTATVGDEHKVVAFCSVSKHADHIASGINGSVFEVHNLMVDPEFRRIGNAHSVIEEVVLKIGTEGVIIAEAFGEDAEAFWRSADGFEERQTDGGRYFVYSHGKQSSGINV